MPDRDADAGAGGDLVVADLERHGQRLEQPARDLDAVVVVLDVLEQDRELVAAEAGGRVAVAQAGPQPAGHLAAAGRRPRRDRGCR